MIDGSSTPAARARNWRRRRVRCAGPHRKKALYPGTAGGGQAGVRRAQAPGQGPPEEAPGARPMGRSKKWRLEWAFLLGEDGRRKYNKICKGCAHPCKQSFRVVLISCPITSPHAQKSVGIGLKTGRKTACGGFFKRCPYDFPCWPTASVLGAKRGWFEHLSIVKWERCLRFEPRVTISRLLC